MGLAASQARFLGLTARKSNTEYEGQQVNQQRTALANESASLFSKLSNLSVPTPPDVNNYFKTEYTFSYDGQKYTMTSLPIKENSGYTIGVSHDDVIDGYKEVAIDKLGFNPASVESTPTTIGKTEGLKKFLNDDDDSKSVNIYNNNSDIFFQVNDKFYQYVPTTKTVNTPYVGADVKYDESGDIQSISHPTLTHGETINVSTIQVKDDLAFGIATENYEKEKAEYEKIMSQINAKTEILQQQDKTLELRLNQLDTEQNAISTEMDAVQKVIEKNVESTFKTFA